MSLKQNFLQSWKLFWPGAYADLIKLTHKELIGIWLIPISIFIIFFIISAITLGAIAFTKSTITENFDTFQLSVNQSQSESFMLLQNPDIYIDFNSENWTQGDVAFLEDGIHFNKYIVFGASKILYEDIRDIHEPGTSSVMKFILILMLPGLVILWLIIIFVLYLVLGLFFIPLGKLASKFMGQKLTWNSTIKTYFCITVFFAIFDLLIFPFYRIYILSIFIVFILYIFAIFMAGEKHFNVQTKKKHI